MSLILLLDPSRCPRCGDSHIDWDRRRCRNRLCNVRLFRPEDDFPALKRDWVISFWVYFPANSSGLYRGWVRSEHLENPKPDSAPDRTPKPGKDYGKFDPPLTRKAGMARARELAKR